MFNLLRVVPAAQPSSRCARPRVIPRVPAVPNVPRSSIRRRRARRAAIPFARPKQLVASIRNNKKCPDSKLIKVIKLFENYEIVSLGYSCYPKLFINKIIKKETNFFDWIGSSTWSIIKLLKNNFNNFLNKENYYLNKIFKPHNDELLIYNKEYYIRFVHDGDFLKNNEEWNNFENKYTRRINRFNKLLKSEKNLLFFYLEENVLRYNKLYQEIKKYYPKNKENYHIEQSKLEQGRMFDIVKILKAKYNKHNFKIIYFSHFIDKTNYTDNIIFIKTDCHYDKLEWHEWVNSPCTKSIIDNYDYINDILNK
jgi:hypothetical protein